MLIWGGVAIVAVVVVLAGLLYNNLARARNRAFAAWADVDAELRRFGGKSGSPV